MKDLLGISGSASDTLITNMIRAATRQVEYRCNKAVLTGTYTLTENAFPVAAPIILEYPPAVAVSSIAYIDTDGTSQTIDSSNYTLVTGGYKAYIDHHTGWPAVHPYRGKITVVYTAGHGTTSSDCPDLAHNLITEFVCRKFWKREGGPIEESLQWALDLFTTKGAI